LDSILIVGLILFVGFVTGEVAEKVHLPKISGYILAGILLNPRLLPFIPTGFTKHTDLVTDIGLALSMRGMPEFSGLSDSLIGIVIGAVVIHELFGPFLAKTALVKAGEITK